MDKITELPVPEMRGTVGKGSILLAHILAGKAILTVRSKVSNSRYTFSFRRPPEGESRKRPIWVSVLQKVGDKNWSFMGTIWANETEPWNYNLSPKSQLKYNDPAHAVVSWIIQRLPDRSDLLLDQAEWWHEGCCGRCGRRLTVPESIETGFGPECVKYVKL